MATGSQRPNRHEVALSSLGAAAEALDLAEERSSIAPAKTVFGAASVILKFIRVSFLLV